MMVKKTILKKKKENKVQSSKVYSNFHSTLICIMVFFESKNVKTEKSIYMKDNTKVKSARKSFGFTL